jgi:hypothetical protein
MKKINVLKLSIFSLLFTALIPIGIMAQDGDDRSKLQTDADNAKAEFIKADGLLQNLFDKSVGYVIFPNVG